VTPYKYFTTNLLNVNTIIKNSKEKSKKYNHPLVICYLSGPELKFTRLVDRVRLAMGGWACA
jgi:hypothetical protein